MISTGCYICEINGQYKNQFNTMIFEPERRHDNSLNLQFKARTDAEWRQIASSGIEEKSIKGLCQLMRLPYVDLPTICPPEPMHSQYLGKQITCEF